MKYKLTEIGYDTSIETTENLIKIAFSHCKSYEDRIAFLPIENIEQAINYLKTYGFTIEKL